MIFETYNGKCFNSISLEHLKSRFDLSHSEYSICIPYGGKLYVHASCDTLEACKKKAERFVKQYHTSIQVYYFERPTADEWCQELIEEIHCSGRPHCHAPEKEVHGNEPDKLIEDSTQKYLNYMNNIY